MVILYCETCGLRISESDANSGKALQTGENAWQCASCANASNPSAATAPAAPAASAPPKRIESGTKQRVSKNVSTLHRVEVDRRAIKKPINTSLIAGVCGAAVAGLLLVVFMRMGKGDATTPVAKTSPPSGGDSKAPSAVTTSDSVKTPPSSSGATQPAATASSKSAGTGASVPNVVESPATPKTADAPKAPMDLAKQADLEMENFRNGRAQRLLDDARQLLAQNPGEVRAYKRKLNEITLSYGSAPAAMEARKLLGEIKSQPSTLPEDLGKNVAESAEYKLVYDADLFNVTDRTMYDENLSETITTPFDRIAYYMQLTTQAGESRWVYVSLDAFTNEIHKTGIPFLGTGARFQQTVTNMNVYSNVKEIVSGVNLASGSMEFWGTNYSGSNNTNIPGASGGVYDFGDEVIDSGDYGSMQIHNLDARQTIFAFNHWLKGASSDIGIGNQPANHPDWTFSGSAKLYRSARLLVLVRLKK